MLDSAIFYFIPHDILNAKISKVFYSSKKNIKKLFCLLSISIWGHGMRYKVQKNNGIFAFFEQNNYLCHGFAKSKSYCSKIKPYRI